MNPIENLKQIETWATFRPNMRGYLPPAIWDRDELERYDGLDGLFIETFDPSFMKPHAGKIASYTEYSEAVNPGVQVGDDLLPLPLDEPSFWKVAASSTMWLPQQMYHVEPSKVTILNQNWELFLSKAAKPLLDRMHVDVPYKLKLTGFGMKVGEMTDVSLLKLSQTSEHFATLIVLLPARNLTAKFSATFDGAQTISIDMPDAMFNTNIIAFYTGLEQVQLGSHTHDGTICYLTYQVNATTSHSIPTPLNTSNVFTLLRDAFRVWRFVLANPASNHGVSDIPEFLIYVSGEFYPTLRPRHLKGDDKKYLSHVAPYCKAYGFQLLFAQVTHVTNSPEFSHWKGYDELDGDYVDYDPKDFDMPRIDEEHDEGWTELTAEIFHVDGQPVANSFAEKLEKKLGARIKNYDYSNVSGRLDFDDNESPGIEKEVYVADEMKFEVMLQLVYTRKASVLMVLPEELVM